jgi:hypothetical protein
VGISWRMGCPLKGNISLHVYQEGKGAERHLAAATILGLLVLLVQIVVDRLRHEEIRGVFVALLLQGVAGNRLESLFDVDRLLRTGLKERNITSSLAP